MFEEALPIAGVETGNTYRFDLVNNSNSNGTSDGGLLQINDVTYPYIVEQLKTEEYIFDDWSKFNPKFNISAGIYWISHLKNKYNLEDHSLFSSYNRGVSGARDYANRNGSYETGYSRRVIKKANEFNKIIK